MSENFYYRLENFLPPESIRSGSWGFKPIMEVGLAKKAISTELNPGYEAELQYLGDRIIKRVGFGGRVIFPAGSPYKFVKNEKGKSTCFSHLFSVPGNGCLLEFPDEEIEELKRRRKFNLDYIEFIPHNVDNLSQQYALASIWLTWARRINNILTNGSMF